MGRLPPRMRRLPAPPSCNADGVTKKSGYRIYVTLQKTSCFASKHSSQWSSYHEQCTDPQGVSSELDRISALTHNQTQVPDFEGLIVAQEEVCRQATLKSVRSPLGQQPGPQQPQPPEPARQPLRRLQNLPLPLWSAPAAPSGCCHLILHYLREAAGSSDGQTYIHGRLCQDNISASACGQVPIMSTGPCRGSDAQHRGGFMPA